MDLSHPKGKSMNGGIETELCSLRYTSVDEAVYLWIMGHGSRSFILRQHNVPVHPEDSHLLGMVWGGDLYMNIALLFGLRSAPKTFNALANGFQWILEEEGAKTIHYLMIFLFFEPPGGGGGQRKESASDGDAGISLQHDSLASSTMLLSLKTRSLVFYN